ncbi:hypothetical protein HDK77DRAFT_470577 [Phyllosticta capitalensis]
MLLELPLDLLLEIKDYLDNPADVEALRLASKGLKASLKRDDAWNSTKDTARRLSWDKMCREVDAELAGSPLKFCGRCRKAHPEEEFSREQLRLGNPWSRICRGRERRYQICSDFWYDYIEISELHVNGKGVKCGYFHLDHNPCLKFQNCSCREPVCTDFRRQGSRYRHVSKFQLRGWPCKDPIFICPHTTLQPTDLALMKSKNASLKKDFDSSGSERIVGECKYSHCGAHFRLEPGFCISFFEPEPNDLYITRLKIQANHHFESPTHPEWLAKTVPVKIEQITKSEFRNRFLESNPAERDEDQRSLVSHSCG